MKVSQFLVVLMFLGALDTNVVKADVEIEEIEETDPS
jgi:hypothetical protein